jgi:hypothetical protein
VLDVDVIFQHDVAQRFAGVSFDDGAVRAQFGVGQEYDLWHL